ncbi:MAG TPA: C25 family peptidase propeptide domain-containing protein, partial [Candidatus Polarisedimenticolia bacterium]|nr:C25 family peptidase propeptide domain-containing protein [Candidatus Polarisedimenticolia bacterium]
MKSSVLRLAVTAVILILTAAPGAGSPSDDRGVVPLDLTAGSPELEPAGDRLHVVARIAGFGLTSRVGEPLLPLRIVLVAIPEGSDPELEVVSASSRTIPGIAIAPVPRLRVRERLGEGQVAPRGKPEAPSPLDDDFAPDRHIYGRDAEFPASPVRLGAIGYLREQRYVEVLFTPVLYNPARREARFFEEVQARVRFTLAQAPAGPGAGAAFRPDPFFEETYRRSLVNYEQGKLFRVVRGGAAPSATSASSPVPASDSASSRSSLG